MKFTMIQGCMVMLISIALITCDGSPIPISGSQEVKVLSTLSRQEQQPKSSRGTNRSVPKESLHGHDESEATLDVDLPTPADDSKTVPVAEERADDNLSRNPTTRESRDSTGRQIEKRENTGGNSKGFTTGPNLNPDRIDFLLGIFPFLGYRPHSGRSHWHSHRPHPSISYKPSPYPPPTSYKPSPYPPSRYPHKPHEGPKPPYKPYYEAPKPEPLPPFPPEGPDFGDYMADFPGHHPPPPPPHFPDYGDEEYADHKKPHPPPLSNYKDHKPLTSDFDPPNFFEHSGLPHPPEDYVDDEHPPHDEGYHNYPMKPYSDDPDVEFFPPDSYEGHEPMVYTGPPKPHKHIPPAPKPPSPPQHPYKLPYRPDINLILHHSIYRDDIPHRVVHNENDNVTNNLVPTGIKGLSPETLDCIHKVTKLYVDYHNEYDEDHKDYDADHTDYDANHKEYDPSHQDYSEDPKDYDTGHQDYGDDDHQDYGEDHDDYGEVHQDYGDDHDDYDEA